jgi:PhnB protein
MKIMPYIHFDGDCAEAMQAYCAILQGADLQVMRYGDAPPGGEPMVPGSTRVIHSQFTAESGAVLMASDFPPGMPGQPQAAVSVMLGPKTVARAREIFDALAGGGAVIQTFGPSFFSPGFGMVKDRFGTHWIIGAEAA